MLYSKFSSFFAQSFVLVFYWLLSNFYCFLIICATFRLITIAVRIVQHFSDFSTTNLFKFRPLFESDLLDNGFHSFRNFASFPFILIHNWPDSIVYRFLGRRRRRGNCILTKYICTFLHFPFQRTFTEFRKYFTAKKGQNEERTISQNSILPRKIYNFSLYEGKLSLQPRYCFLIHFHSKMKSFPFIGKVFQCTVRQRIRMHNDWMLA